MPLSRPPNLHPLRALRSLVDGIGDLLTGSWGVLVEGSFKGELGFLQTVLG